MAVITNSTFDPMKVYVRVRLAQGVPIVDADVNEREDIDLFELQTFQKWFAGNGVPDGNDGFRIAEAPNRTNNFLIRSGFGAASTDPLVDAGRCLVNGLAVMVTQDVEFTAQELFETNPNIASVEARLRAPRIPAMSAGAGPRLYVWLDVWDSVVTHHDDAKLLHSGLGTESCTRDRRNWAVRVGNIPTPPGLADHSYYLIAEIARRPGDANVNQADIVDMREQRLLMLPSTLVPDLFNVSVLDYRRGNFRPAISLRQAINALIRGEIPATPETVIALAPAANDVISRGVFFQGSTLAVTWHSNRTLNTNQIFLATLDTANPNPSFSAPQQLTANSVHSLGHAAPLRNGRVLLVSEAGFPTERIRFKTDTLANLVAAAEADVVTGGTPRERRPFVVPLVLPASDHAIVTWHESASSRWQFSRFDGAAFSAKADLSTTLTNLLDLHAARDATDGVWAAFAFPPPAGVASDIQVVRLPPGAGAVPVNETVLTTANLDKNPFVLVDRADAPWVFWISTTGAGAATTSSIMYSRRSSATGFWSTAAAIPGLPPGNFTSNAPTAVIDADDSIWVFWDNFLSVGGNKDIWYARLDPVSGVWTGSRPTTGTADQDLAPVALARGDGVLWLVWNRIIAGNGELLLPTLDHDGLNGRSVNRREWHSRPGALV